MKGRKEADNTGDKASAFMESRRQELNRLSDNGTFVPEICSEFPPNTRAFGSRFVDTIKLDDQGDYRRKSRLVTNNHNDEGFTTIETRAPTLKRCSQIILPALAASDDAFIVFIRDVTQAYVQFTSSLERNVYITA